jgi:hypothetical protein
MIYKKDMKKWFLVLLAFLLFCFVSTEELGKIDIISEQVSGFQENEVVVRKRLEDVLKWFKRYIDELKEADTPRNGNSTVLEKDVIEYVMSLNRTELTELGYLLEKYHRRVTGGKDLIGGLHDYVFRIPDDQIRKYVFDELKEHPEISKKMKLEKLVEDSKTQTEEVKTYDRDFIIGEGIHDYLKTLNRDSLNKLALGLENYHRKLKDEFVFGGLHDYITQISDEDVKAYILKEANEHTEINSVKALDEFVNISLNLVKDQIDPSLLELLNKADKDKLLKIFRKIMKEIKMGPEESALIIFQIKDKSEEYIRDYVKNRINSFPDKLNDVKLFSEIN